MAKVLITGTSKGIGYHATLLLARAGHEEVDALSFLGWRIALSDEDWVGLGGLSRDADYLARVSIDTGVDLRLA